LGGFFYIRIPNDLLPTKFLSEEPNARQTNPPRQQGPSVPETLILVQNLDL
jgi:hypothetical protein